MKRVFIILLILTSYHIKAQSFKEKELSFSEYIGYVKKYHPLVRQSGLLLNRAEAELLTARGGFDPKIEVDYDQKDFKDKNYYSLLKSTFKIPTWYGIEIKAAFDNSEGLYVNPQNTTPNNGLTSIGISIPLGQGLFINKRMADVRMAKVQLQLSAAEQKWRQQMSYMRHPWPTLTGREHLMKQSYIKPIWNMHRSATMGYYVL